MKNIYFLTAFVLLLFSCSKSGGEDIKSTTITITNQYETSLSNVLLAKMGSDSKPVLVVNIGSINKGTVEEVDVTGSSLTNVCLFYEYREGAVVTTFQVKNPYPVSAGQSNTISVNRSTETIKIDKNSAAYPGGTVTNPPPTGSGACGFYNGKPLYKGAEGGCYYINSKGKKTYVERSKCGC